MPSCFVLYFISLSSLFTLFTFNFTRFTFYLLSTLSICLQSLTPLYGSLLPLASSPLFSFLLILFPLCLPLPVSPFSSYASSPVRSFFMFLSLADCSPLETDSSFPSFHSYVSSLPLLPSVFSLSPLYPSFCLYGFWFNLTLYSLFFGPFLSPLPLRLPLLPPPPFFCPSPFSCFLIPSFFCKNSTLPPLPFSPPPHASPPPSPPRTSPPFHS